MGEGIHGLLARFCTQAAELAVVPLRAVVPGSCTRVGAGGRTAGVGGSTAGAVLRRVSMLAVVPLSLAVVPLARVLQAMLELAVALAVVPVEVPVTRCRFQKRWRL